MTPAQPGDKVQVHYTGKTDDEVFDTSEGRDPLEFTVGEGQVIPGFDEAVEGMEKGDEKTITLPPEDAYGPRQDGLEMEIPKAQLPDDLNPERGDLLEVADGQGGRGTVEVVATEGDSITVDRNHPLAGKTLTFDIEVVDIE